MFVLNGFKCLFIYVKGPLHVFYGLTNFFQNHRRYVMSRDDEQLNGKAITVPSEDCEPYRYSEENGIRKIIAPCGAIANSLFNGVNTVYTKCLVLLFACLETPSFGAEITFKILPF